MSEVLYTSHRRISDVVIKEKFIDIKYTREFAPVLLTVDGVGEHAIQVGEILYQDLDVPNSPFERIARAQAFPTNFRVGIIADERIGDTLVHNKGQGTLMPDWSVTSTDTVNLALIVRGDCIVRGEALTFGTDTVTTVAESTALAKLEEQGIYILYKHVEVPVVV